MPLPSSSNNDDDEFAVGTRVIVTGLVEAPNEGASALLNTNTSTTEAVIIGAPSSAADGDNHYQVRFTTTDAATGQTCSSVVLVAPGNLQRWPPPPNATEAEPQEQPLAEQETESAPTTPSPAMLLAGMAQCDPQDLQQNARRVLEMSQEEWESNLGGVRLRQEDVEMFRRFWTSVAQDPARVQSVLAQNPENLLQAFAGLIVPEINEVLQHEQPQQAPVPQRVFSSPYTSQMDGPRMQEFLFAVENWNVAEVKRLLQQNHKRLYGYQNTAKQWTAIHLATMADRAPTVDYLLQQRQRKEADLLNLRDADGCTPLHLAAMFHCPNAARILLDAGADPNPYMMVEAEMEVTPGGKPATLQTPLENAAVKGYESLSRMLLETGKIPQETLNAALFMAVFGTSIACTRLLLQYGADVNAKLGGSGVPGDMPIFHFMCGRGLTDLVEVFLEQEDLDLTVRYRQLTAVDLALSSEHHNVIRLIQSSGKFHPHIANPLLQRYMETDANKSNDIRCHGCAEPADKIMATNECYSCLSCRQQGAQRVLCAECVLGAPQLANHHCPNHVVIHSRVFINKGAASSPAQEQAATGERKIRGTFQKERVDVKDNVRCRRWLEMSRWLEACKLLPPVDDELNLYETVKDLSRGLDAEDSALLRNTIASEVPILTDILATIGIPSRFDNSVNQIQQAWHSCMPGNKEYMRDLSWWVRSRAMRPINVKVPAWVSLLGCLPSLHPALCDMIAIITLTKLSQNRIILERQEDAIKSRLTRFRQVQEKPRLVKTLVGNLPVALIPSTILFQTTHMPEHGDCGWDNAKSLPQGPTLRLFISHRWRLPEHPDKEGIDWAAIQDCLFVYVQRAILLYINLTQLGFCHEAIGTEPFLDPAMHSEFLVVARRMGHIVFGAEKDPSTRPGDVSAMVKVTYEPLLARILEIICHCQGDGTSVFADGGISKLFEKILGRIFLWIDFVCLPQKVTRERTASQYKWFRQSLDNMGSIQLAMISVLVEPREEYFSRAWCVAEYINTAQEFSIASSHDTSVESLPKTKPDLEAWLRVMLGPNVVTAQDVIEHLGLSITNKTDADVVCAVVWSRVAQYHQLSATAGATSSTNRLMGTAQALGIGNETRNWVVARGNATTVANYFHAMDKEEFLDYRCGWLHWRKALMLSDVAEPQSKTLDVVLLVDSCVASLPHMLLPTLQSLAVFLDAYVPSTCSVQITLLSDYTEDTIRDLKQADAWVVALPTSVFANHADYVVLHPTPMKYEELPLLENSENSAGQCVVS